MYLPLEAEGSWSCQWLALIQHLCSAETMPCLSRAPRLAMGFGSGIELNKKPNEGIGKAVWCDEWFCTQKWKQVTNLQRHTNTVTGFWGNCLNTSPSEEVGLLPRIQGVGLFLLGGLAGNASNLQFLIFNGFGTKPEPIKLFIYLHFFPQPFFPRQQIHRMMTLLCRGSFEM